MGNRSIGLDIGSSGVRAVELSFAKGVPRLERVASLPLPRGAVEAGEIRDGAAVTKALKQMWADNKFSTKQVTFGLANADVMVRPMILQLMEPAEFKRALPYEVADYLTIPVEEVTLDFHVLREFDEPNASGTGTKRMVQILLVVIPNNTIKAYVSAITDAGLMPVRADHISFALIRAASPNASQPDVAEVVLDIGADITNVIIHQAGQPRFVRLVVGFGGHSVDDALMQAWPWDADEAERTKVGLGLPSEVTAVMPSGNSFWDDEPDGVAVQAPVPAHPAQEVINTVTAGLIEQIRGSVAFFLSETKGVESLRRVVLSGGGSLMTGLQARLASELRVPVEYGNPLAHIQPLAKGSWPSKIPAETMSVAVGLAMRVS